MRHLQLVKPVPVPAYVEHGGLPVTWWPWQPPHRFSPVTLACAGCGTDGHIWSTTGLVGPEPGVQPPRRAWRIPQLFAFRCALCGAMTVYDSGASGAEWTEIDIERPVLR